jgi:hypothetical protein
MLLGPGEHAVAVHVIDVEPQAVVRELVAFEMIGQPFEIGRAFIAPSALLMAESP